MQIPFDARPLYRVRRSLAYSREIIPRNSLHRLDKIDETGIARLLERGSIGVVSAPPLSVLPGWTRRADRLAECGIDDAVQFIGADVGAVAETFGVKTTTVEKWKREVACMLGAPDGKGRRR